MGGCGLHCLVLEREGGPAVANRVVNTTLSVNEDVQYIPSHIHIWCTHGQIYISFYLIR